MGGTTSMGGGTGTGGYEHDLTSLGLRERSTCGDHDDFDNKCVFCVRRYYNNLIDESFVERYHFDAERAKHRLACAKIASYEVQIKSLQANIRWLMNDVGVDKLPVEAYARPHDPPADSTHVEVHEPSGVEP